MLVQLPVCDTYQLFRNAGQFARFPPFPPFFPCQLIDFSCLRFLFFFGLTSEVRRVLKTVLGKWAALVYDTVDPCKQGTRQRPIAHMRIPERLSGAVGDRHAIWQTYLKIKVGYWFKDVSKHRRNSQEMHTHRGGTKGITHFSPPLDFLRFGNYRPMSSLDLPGLGDR